MLSRAAKRGNAGGEQLVASIFWAPNLKNSVKLRDALSKSGQVYIASRAPFSDSLTFRSTVHLFLVFLLFENNDVIGAQI